MYIDVFIVQLLAIQMVTDITPQGVMFLSLCSIQHIFYKCRHYFLLVKGYGLLSSNAFLGSLSWYTRFHFVDNSVGLLFRMLASLFLSSVMPLCLQVHKRQKMGNQQTTVYFCSLPVWAPSSQSIHLLVLLGQTIILS